MARGDNTTKMEYQLLVYGEENDILSSSHFDTEPTDEFVESAITEDGGVRAELYEVEYPSESSKLIAEFSN